MNAPDLAARTVSPWQRDLYAIGRILDDRARTHAAAAPERPTQALWWGAGYSGLLATCTCAGDGSLVLADTDPRRLRRSHNATGGAARTIALLALANLRRDRHGVEVALKHSIPRDVDGYLACEEQLAARFQAEPAIADAWASRIVMDFALNRIREEDEAALLAEAFRVMAGDGVTLSVALVGDAATARQDIRAAPPGPPLRIPTETALLRAFERAGFHGIRLFFATAESPAYVDRIHDADIRVCLVEACKGTQGPCLELGQAVVYGGPWREVRDDDGHVFPRGERVAVCAKTYGVLMREPYRNAMTGFRSASEPPPGQALPFDCNASALRDPRITKGTLALPGQAAGAPTCGPGSNCC